MARHARRLPVGNASTQHISAGVLALCFPMAEVQAILRRCGRANNSSPPPRVSFQPVKDLAQAAAAQLRDLISMMLAFAGRLDAQQPGLLPASFCLGISQGNLVGQIRPF